MTREGRERTRRARKRGRENRAKRERDCTGEARRAEERRPPKGEDQRPRSVLRVLSAEINMHASCCLIVCTLWEVRTIGQAGG